MKLRRLAAHAAAASVAFAVAASPTRAQTNDDMRRAIEELQRQIQVLKDRLDKQETQQKAQSAAPAAPPAAAPATAAAGQHEFLERKPGDNVTFFTRGGEATIYGNLDLSIDDISKGISGMTNDAGQHPVGRGGYMTDISTNVSFIGIRGFQTI